MEEILDKIDLKNLDKSDWKTYRFEEIAQKISKTVKPEKANVDIYVGLEHLDAEDIHIRRKGVPADVKGGKLRCAPGDVIFGKRRAYQRKAAIVDFEGICSAHAFVFRASPEVIDPRLFPFFLHSDQFMHRMVDISVGGLSPTINWGDLKNQEFLLPPKEQQADLAKLLCAIDQVIEKEKELINNICLLEASYRTSELERLDTEEVKIEKLILPMSRIKIGKIDKSQYLENGKYPIIDQSMEFIVGYTDQSDLVYKGKLPVLIFGDHTTVIKFIDFPFVMGADGTKVISPSLDLDVYYLYQAIKKINLKPQGYRRHFSILKNEKVKVPNDFDWISNFKSKMLGIEKSRITVKSKIIHSQYLQKSLINQIF